MNGISSREEVLHAKIIFFIPFYTEIKKKTF